MASLIDYLPDATRDERTQLENALLRGERLLWAVRPTPSARMGHSLSLLLFSLPWLAITATVTWAALGAPGSFSELRLPSSGGQWGALAVLSIFWLIGLWLAASPWQKKRSMRRTIYLLTDRRALVMTSGDVEAYKLTPGLLLERRQRANGCGDLIFGSGKIRHSSEEPEGFLNVPDVRLAEEKLEEAMRAAAQERS